MPEKAIEDTVVAALEGFESLWKRNQALEAIVRKVAQLPIDEHALDFWVAAQTYSTTGEHACLRVGDVREARRLLAEEIEESRLNEIIDFDWANEDPGTCTRCGKLFELVRPGKSQSTCECWNSVGDSFDATG